MENRKFDITLETRRSVSDIIFAYRQIHSSKPHPLSLRQLAKEINNALQGNHKAITYQTIKNWEDRMHLPRVYTLYTLALTSTGWISDLAHDLLAAVRPERYQPATFIGQRALERSLIDTGPLKPRYDQHYRNVNFSSD